MDSLNTLWSWIVCCAITVLAAMDSECPRDVLQKAMLCTANLGIGPPTSGPPQFVEMGEVEKAKTACREGLFTKTISCLAKLTEKCTGNTEREHILRMMVDPEKSRVSVEYFCKNIDVYETHASCIADAHPEQSNCTHEVKNNFRTKAMATVNMDVLITSTCRYYKAAVSCSSKVIQKRCGTSASDVVVTILHGFQPPKCLEIKFEDEETYTIDNEEKGAAVMHSGHWILVVSFALWTLDSYLSVGW